MNFGNLFESGKNKAQAKKLRNDIAMFERAAVENVTPNDAAGSTREAARLREQLDNLEKGKQG